MVASPFHFFEKRGPLSIWRLYDIPILFGKCHFCQKTLFFLLICKNKNKGFTLWIF
jgi:hypothetical protein